MKIFPLRTTISRKAPPVKDELVKAKQVFCLDKLSVSKVHNKLNTIPSIKQTTQIEDDHNFPIDMLDMNVDVTIWPEEKRIEGKSTLHFNFRNDNDSEYKNTQFFLDKNIRITGIVDENGKPVTFERKDALIFIHGLSKGEHKFTISYAGKIEKTAPTASSFIDKDYGLLPSTSYWFPFQYGFDITQGELKVSLPSEYTAVGTGKLKDISVKDGMTTRVWDNNEGARGGFAVAFGRYNEFKWQKDGIQVEVYATPEHSDKGEKYLEEMQGILGFYKEIFGFYPFNKLSLVEVPSFPNYLGRGAEDSLVLVDDLNLEKPTFLLKHFLAHETSHQWWCNTTGGLKNSFFVESFAEISALLYSEKREGNDTVKKMRKIWRDNYLEQVEKLGDGSISELGSGYKYATDDRSGEVIYKKGPHVLHMLKKYIGEESFLKILSEFARETKWKNPDLKQFYDMVNKYSKENMDWFFNQWIEGIGIPELSVISSLKDGKLNYSVIQKDTKFKFPLEIEIEYENGEKERLKVMIENSETSLRIRSDFKVKKIILDPDVDLLIKIS